MSRNYNLKIILLIKIIFLIDFITNNSFLVLNLANDEKLLGKNAQEYAQILKWLSLANSELLPSLASAFKPLIGASPYNKKQVDDNTAYANKVANIFEERLANYTYLVGERLSLADLLATTSFLRGYDHLYGAQWRKQYPNITRWFKTIIKTPILSEFIGDYKFREKPVEYTPPKKEKKQQPKAEKAEKAPKPAAAAPAEPAQAPKPKHPLSLLPPAKTSIDEWKRTYSNEETREVAIPFFWEKIYNPEDYSLWKVDYKYNDELTLTFMSNNLVGGFFARLSASTKFMFGSMVVFGENNNNGITGFFLIRGQDHVPAFDVAPDWESYDFKKLDAKNDEDVKFINNMLAWDEPVVVNGEKKEIADGKVFK